MTHQVVVIYKIHKRVGAPLILIFRHSPGLWPPGRAGENPLILADCLAASSGKNPTFGGQPWAATSPTAASRILWPVGMPNH